MTRPIESVEIHESGYRLRVAPEYAALSERSGLVHPAGYKTLLASARSVRGGRGENLLLEDAGWGETIRLRPVRHGGWLARLLGDRFLRPTRVFCEFDTWLHLRSRGVSLPEPIFAVSLRRRLFWRSALATRELPNTQDAATWLASGPDGTTLQAASDQLALAIRRFHDAGAIHGDLHLRNLLFEIENEVEAEVDAGDVSRVPSGCWLIDLDRTRIVDRLSPAQRMREWMRLVRSIEKAGLAEQFPARLRARLLRTYCEGDRQLQREMLEGAPREIRRIARHRLVWDLERMLRKTLRRARAVPLWLPLCLISFGFVGATLGGCPLDSIDATDPVEDVRHSILAVGDTGRTRIFASLFEGQLSVAHAMTLEARRHPIDDLILLGDNFYWNGLDREHLVPRIRQNLVRPYCYFLRLDGRRSREVENACSVPPGDRVPVPLFAVLGNHDLELPDSARLQRETVPEFLPDWQMSRELAQVFELGDGLSLILFESEPAIDDPAAIGRAIERAVREARGPWRILATHRPIATDDFGNRLLGGYPDFVRAGLEAAGVPVQLVLAAHHHNLQIFEVDAPLPSLHVVVGSGARAEPPLAQQHPDARFGRIALGFARIDLLGVGANERLSVTLIEAARWPFLSRLNPPKRVARFEVDRAGRVYSKLTSEPESAR